MTLKQIDSFRAVYRLQNVSKAAQSIYLSPQAVSKNIQRLEDELGVQLFERTTRGMTPLATADYLYEESGYLAEVLARIPVNLEQLGAKVMEIPVGIGYSVLPFLGEDLLRKYEEEHPEIKLHINDRTDLELEEMLLKDQLQFVLSVGPLDEKKYVSYPLKKDSMCVGLLPNHPLYRKETVTMRDLQEHAIILCGDRFRTYYEWEAFRKREGLECRSVITFTEYWAFVQMMDHMELAWISPSFVAEISYPEMRFIKIPGYDWQVVLGVRKGRQLPAATQELIHYIVRQFSAVKSLEK